MAGQPSSVGGDGNQDRPVRAAIASLCGTAGWNHQERVPGSNLFWTTADLEAKLREFQKYFNEHRTHAGIEGRLPDSGGPGSPISLASYRWQKHCRGLHQT